MIPSVPPDDDARAEAERHIVEHSLGEAARIGRLSRIPAGTFDGSTLVFRAA
jgi:hypothetical protein